MLTILIKLFKALNSEQSPKQLAIGLSLAVILGFTPFMSLHNVIVLLVALWFRVNLTLLIVSYPLFAFIGYLLSSLFEKIGLALLQAPSMLSTWEGFFNTLIGRWSNFYFAGVMGSFVVAVIVAIIIFPIASSMIAVYREKWLEKIAKFKITKLLKASKFWQLYAE